MIDKCPRCGTSADVPWVWKLFFKITNPIGMKKLTQLDLDINFDVNKTVAEIVTNEAVIRILQNPEFAILRQFVTGENLRALLDRILPDQVTRKVGIYHCWKCGKGEILPAE